MNIEFHSESSRGFADHGWLKAKHSFSFASWFNRHRMHFGALRVLNDDVIAGNMGFGKHPHDNMEIITIPLSGSLKHQDSMGFSEVVKTGEIQVMSAGTGITHSEFNASASEELSLFQIWIFPNKQNVEPRYGQMTYDNLDITDRFVQLVSPNADDDGLWIHQDAWIHLIDMSKGSQHQYKLKKPGNGLYIMNMEGQKEIHGQIFNKRDAAGITDANDIQIQALEKGRLLCIEVPIEI